MGRKIKPYSIAWEKLANEMARTFSPDMYPCADCNNPVFKGYCCDYCGSDHPYEKTTKNRSK